MRERPVVVVTSTSFSRSDSLLRELEALGVAVVANREGRKLAGADLRQFVGASSAVIAVVGLERVDAEVLRHCPRLKFVAKYGVGLDNIDVDALRLGGVELGWTGGVNKRSVSELVLAFALGHSRNVLPSVLKMRENQWIKDGGRLLSGCTVGIVGLGHVGTDLARLLRGFGCRIIYADILEKPAEELELGIKRVAYDELLATSDIISFHVPSTPLTRGMFGSREIDLAKPGALVVNTARGDIVEFEATTEAVLGGRLGGFAADVFPDEPYAVARFNRSSNLYFTPHIGGNAAEAVLAMGRSAIAHVERWLTSRP